MKPLTRRFVDYAFRLAAEGDYLERNGERMPGPSVLCAMEERAGFDWSDPHCHVAANALASWSSEGAAVFSFAPETAQQFWTTARGVSDLPHATTEGAELEDIVMIEVGAAILLVWGANSSSPCGMGFGPQPAFMGEDANSDALLRFLGNTREALRTRPVALEIRASHPSLTAARKAARKAGKPCPAYVPGRLYVIGPDRAYERKVVARNEADAIADEASGSSDESGPGTRAVARHSRSGHFRNQPYGEKRALRKRIWIEKMIVGKGPTLVRAQRLDDQAAE